MKKLWSDRAWDDYLYWQRQDKKMVKRINELVKSIEREGCSKGIGKPEPLKYRKAWSRRIDDANRLVYDIDENGYLSFPERRLQPLRWEMNCVRYLLDIVF